MMLLRIQLMALLGVLMYGLNVSIQAFSPSTILKIRYEPLQQFSMQREQREELKTSTNLLHTPATYEKDPQFSRIVAIRNKEDFIRFLEEDDRLCVVKFYASWCKSCTKFGLKYRKLAFDDGDRVDKVGSISRIGHVRFAEVEYSLNANLCKTLKVKKLPTVHMYKKGKGKISEMSCKPSQFQDVVDEMNRLLMSIDEMDKRNAVDSLESKKDSDQIKPYVPSFFEQTMLAGVNLGEEIMAKMKLEKYKETAKNGSVEKSWGPFKF